MIKKIICMTIVYIIGICFPIYFTQHLFVYNEISTFIHLVLSIVSYVIISFIICSKEGIFNKIELYNRRNLIYCGIFISLIIVSFINIKFIIVFTKYQVYTILSLILGFLLSKSKEEN